MIVSLRKELHTKQDALPLSSVTAKAFRQTPADSAGLHGWMRGDCQSATLPEIASIGKIVTREKPAH
jgi:hypothetical protein